MTQDREVAKRETVALARTANVAAYLYLLNSGYYYVSLSPPGFFNADYVGKAEREIPGAGEPRFRP
ncbi:MAG TPA: hypothetical protein VGG86_14025 [Roseiarcus sp.]|jgi:hypothetical protein